jgi:general secretion pathway protein K
MKTRGFVLVNALVMVAALSAIAVVLLSLAEGGRARLSAGQTAGQFTLQLDSVEALARTLLTNSAGDGPDHLGSLWAQRSYDLELDNGHVTGEISDLQGRFNLNWLSNKSNTAARDAFDRLLAGLGVSPAVGQAIIAYLKPGGPENKTAFLAMDPPQNPVGGSLLMISQLDDLPGLSSDVRARLRPHLTVLPAGSRLNPNTATPAVLAAFLPKLNRAQIGGLLALRQRQPFDSAQAFLLEVGLATVEDGQDGGTVQSVDEDTPPPSLSEDRISVTSQWFSLTASAELSGFTGARTALIQRKGVPPQTEVVWRVSTRP